MRDILIGSHVSLKAPDMLVGTVKEALSYGANTFMFYTGAPQNTKRRDISELMVPEAKKLMQEENIDIKNLVVHAPYIINLANNTKPYVFDLAKDFLKKEIERTNEIGCKYIVLHPGSHVGSGEEIGTQKIVEGLNHVLKDDQSDVMILLETMSGKGSEIGYKFEQIKQIMDMVEKKEKIGVCLDTCHIHEAGYDIINDLDSVIDHFDNVVGLQNLKAIHVNDSKNPIGAKKDRHANIGQGEIGLETIKRIVHHPKLEGKIFILETPWIGDKAPYKEEIAILREKTH